MAVSSSLLRKLTQATICKGLSQSEVTELFDIAEETTALRGSTLFKEGELADSLLVVMEGQVDVTKKSQLLAKIGEGSVLGEMSLLGAGSTRSATATAITDVKALRFPGPKFHRLLNTHNLAALKVVNNLAQVMSKRLLMMDEKLVEVMDRGKKKEELVDFQKALNRWAF